MKNISQNQPKTSWSISINDLIFRQKENPIEFLMKECTSFRSAPQQASVDFFECNTAMNYVAALIVLSLRHNPRNMIQIEPFLEKSKRAAYYNNYEGKWIVVKELLDVKTFCLNNLLKKLPDFFSPEEFYGNIIPEMKRMDKSIRFRNWHHRSTAPVKRKQRPRGYTDKGTSTPLHEKRIGVSDTRRLYQMELRRKLELGPMPVGFTPRDDQLLEKRIYRNSNYKKLSSMYDELFKIKEELDDVKETEQLIRRTIKRTNLELKRAIRRREKEEEKPREPGGESNLQN